MRSAVTLIVIDAATLQVAPAQAIGVGAVLENDQGLTAPCIAVGPVLTYCVHELERAGWVVRKEVGASGLTLGLTAQDDGVVSVVAPGSAAEQAGLQVGDRLTAVDDRAVRASAARKAKEATFGTKGRELRLTLRRGGETLERRIALAPAAAPPGEPKAPNFLVGVHPIVNWEDRYIPCMGAGLAGQIAVATCVNGFRKHGYIPVGALGASGLTFGDTDPARAVVAAIASPAAEADVRVGDELTAVDGQPLAGGSTTLANERLFGRPGEIRRVDYLRGSEKRTARLTLRPRTS